MYSLLMSDCAERAVSDPCDGAATAAAGSATDTVTLSEMFAMLSLIAISSGLPELVVCTPLRRTTSKPGTMSSRAYEPGGTANWKWPRPSVEVDCMSPLCSLRDITTAPTTACASGSCTTPAIAADCARAEPGAMRNETSASALIKRVEPTHFETHPT